MYLSELDPTWNDSEFAFVLNPEATLFTTPPVRASCAADATKALAGTAMDSLFWCMGAQGSPILSMVLLPIRQVPLVPQRF
ncbi:conjugal transfer pilus assembly protein TraU [Fluoribacter dumoffii]|uniref:Conjugal transfer pilus assembly protein TraU n=1 Tax=Fluoribacter dumoffii TaxID=463 RepID=A0A377ITH7_9GAMM|nr:conjugal transfer pilus assembly protein TraU [Fluoribacter dumoffii]